MAKAKSKKTKSTKSAKSSKGKKALYSGIGGQAVLEGIMMKNKNEYSVAVRKPDGNIEVQKWDNSESFSNKHKWARIPFVRGVVNFAESLSLGMKTLTYSSSFYEEEESTTGFDKFLEKVFGDKAESVATTFTMILSFGLAIGLFMLVPYFTSTWISSRILNDSLVAIIEGLLRICIFVLYVALISLMKDIKRLYQYHGAEHKCINCIESGRSLNVKNVKKSSRLHRRCGTSFLIFVMIVSIVLFFFIKVDAGWLRIVLRLALVPVIAGISYEIIRFAGNHDNIFVRVLSAPGLLLQKITTKEPDEEMIEVAIAAVEKVFDWQEWQAKRFDKKMAKISDDDSYAEETLEISVRDIEAGLNAGQSGQDEYY